MSLFRKKTWILQNKTTYDPDGEHIAVRIWKLWCCVNLRYTDSSSYTLGCDSWYNVMRITVPANLGKYMVYAWCVLVAVSMG